MWVKSKSRYISRKFGEVAPLLPFDFLFFTNRIKCGILYIMIHKIKFDDYPKQLFIDAINSIKKPDISQNAYFSDSDNTPQIHSIEAFEWLNKKIKAAAIEYFDYLKADRYSEAEVDVYAQKSWLVELTDGGKVGWHRHRNAHISCVFYIDAPKDSCALQFKDVENWEAVFPFSLKQSFYIDEPKVEKEVPVEDGLLIMFPSTLKHGTSISNHVGSRLAVSYDLMVTSKTPYELITLDPKFWKLLD